MNLTTPWCECWVISANTDEGFNSNFGWEHKIFDTKKSLTKPNAFDKGQNQTCLDSCSNIKITQHNFACSNFKWYALA